MTVPALRQLPAPACEPPYDDELDGRPDRRRTWSGADGAVQGTLALAFVLPSGVPAVPVEPVGLAGEGTSRRPMGATGTADTPDGRTNASASVPWTAPPVSDHASRRTARPSSSSS